MNRNLLFREIKSNLKMAVIISFSISVYIVFMFVLYSIMKEQLSLFSDLYRAFPESLRIAFNFKVDQWDRVLVFYMSYFVYHIPIMAGGYSIILGTRILSKEEEKKTAEFLLSRPVSRQQIIGSKLVTLMILVFGVNLISFIIVLFSCGIVSDWDFSVKTLTILHTYGYLMCLFFGVLGFFITVIMKRAKAITGIGIGIVLGSWFFDMMLRTSDRFQYLLFLTPFKYLNLDVGSENYAFEWWRLLFFLGTSAALIVLSSLFYRRKDILI